MDANTSFDLEIRVIYHNLKSRRDLLNKAVDADLTNFRDLVDEVIEIYPPQPTEVASLFYFSMDTKTNIQICSDQELVEMFAKHKDLKHCLLSVCYHSPDSEPPEIPQWEFSGTVHSIEAPFTPSVSCPSLVQPSLQTHTESVDTDFLANPNPSFEHVGIDDERLYIDIGPQKPLPDASNKKGQSEESESETCHESDSDCESLSDDELEDIDEIVVDREPAQKPEVNYDKMDPPMAVGTLYSDMAIFKLALASHATKYEFNYEIEKSDKSRYIVYCSGKQVGCQWRLHASTLKDGTVQVKRNLYPHTGHHSTQRTGSCVGVTKFWVCEQVIDWLNRWNAKLSREPKRKEAPGIIVFRCLSEQNLPCTTVPNSQRGQRTETLKLHREF